MTFLKRLFGGVCYRCGKMAYSDECCQTVTGKIKMEVAALNSKVGKLESIVKDINDREIRRLDADLRIAQIPVCGIKRYPFEASG